MKRLGISFLYGCIFSMPFVLGLTVSVVSMKLLGNFGAMIVGGFVTILMFHLSKKPREHLDMLSKPVTLWRAISGFIGVMATAISTYFITGLLSHYVDLPKQSSAGVYFAGFVIGIVGCMGIISLIKVVSRHKNKPQLPSENMF